MTNITKDELDELINQVKATDYKPYIPILTKEMIKKYKKYISYYNNKGELNKMQTIIKLNLTDIKKIISEYFNVDIKNILVTSCGNDTGDGPYPGSGYYCHIEVEMEN